MPKNFKSHLEAIILKGCDLKKGSHVYFSNVTEQEGLNDLAEKGIFSSLYMVGKNSAL